MTAVSTLNENHAGEKFTAYEDGRDDGLYVCRLSDCATLHIPGGDRSVEVINTLSDFAFGITGLETNAVAAATDAVLSNLEGDWQLPEVCGRFPCRELQILILTHQAVPFDRCETLLAA